MGAERTQLTDGSHDRKSHPMPTTRDPDQMHADDVTAIDELRGGTVG
jgi:hypothetical protein